MKLLSNSCSEEAFITRVNSPDVIVLSHGGGCFTLHLSVFVFFTRNLQAIITVIVN